MEFVSTLLLVLCLIIAVLLIVMVLIQDDQGEGLGGILGGSSSSSFGAKSGNILTRITSVLGVLFFLTSFGLSWFSRSTEDDKILKEHQRSELMSEDGANFWDESEENTESDGE